MTLAMLAASAALGFFIGRWWAVVVALVGVGTFFGGVGAGWWGNGFGDGWQVAIALMLGGVATATSAGVVIRRLFSSA